jgi:hypothetical protein
MDSIDIDSKLAPPALRQPITGPSAWIGADMKQREAEWTYCLSAAEIADLEAAAAGVRARGLDLAAVTRADFPLPTLGPVLDRARKTIRGICSATSMTLARA